MREPGLCLGYGSTNPSYITQSMYEIIMDVVYLDFGRHDLLNTRSC